MLKPTVSLFMICVIVTAALAFTYVGTRDAIAERALLAAENSRREVLPGAEKFEPEAGLSAAVAANPGLGIVKEAYRGIKGNELVGYAFMVESKGYGGNMSISVGIDNSGKITGVRIGDNNETPGLGSKASESPFISQFTNLAPKEPLSVVKNGGTRPEEIDAISGATITSKAVVSAVQAAVDAASFLMKEEVGSK